MSSSRSPFQHPRSGDLWNAATACRKPSAVFFGLRSVSFRGKRLLDGPGVVCLVVCLCTPSPAYVFVLFYQHKQGCCLNHAHRSIGVPPAISREGVISPPRLELSSGFRRGLWRVQAFFREHTCSHRIRDRSTCRLRTLKERFSRP